MGIAEVGTSNALFHVCSFLLRQEAIQRYEHVALLSNEHMQIFMRFDHHPSYSNMIQVAFCTIFMWCFNASFRVIRECSCQQKLLYLPLLLQQELVGVGLWQCLHARGQLLRTAVTVYYTPQIYSSIAAMGLLSKLISQYCFWSKTMEILDYLTFMQDLDESFKVIVVAQKGCA